MGDLERFKRLRAALAAMGEDAPYVQCRTVEVADTGFRIRRGDGAHFEGTTLSDLMDQVEAYVRSVFPERVRYAREELDRQLALQRQFEGAL